MFPVIRKKIEYQVCPKCQGQGVVSRPPWVSADQTQWASTQASFCCDVCNGAKVLPVTTIEEY